MRPPAVVTTMGQLKEQYEEPDWCPAPQQKHQRHPQQQQYQSRGQVEGRDPYWGTNVRGGNSILADDRDTRMPYSPTMGMGMGRGQAPLSPQNYLFQPVPMPVPQPQQQREMASYAAAVKAVNDSMNSDGSGSVTVLRGLWKVFDAAVLELGSELNDSLSNKAIFEGKLCGHFYACICHCHMYHLGLTHADLHLPPI